METPLVRQARLQAFEWHIDQRYDPHPYCFHLMDVVRNLIENGYSDDENIIAAGFLHDSIEDVEGVTRELIAEKFNPTVASLVYAVSGEGANRQEKKQCMIRRLTDYPAAIPIKMADRLANMVSSQLHKPGLFRKYVQELDDYRELFEACDLGLWEQMQDLTKQTLEQ